MLIYCSQLYFYRPQTKLREGTLSQVSVPDTHCCLSVPTYRWQAGGTHPTGMLSCFSQLVYLYFAFLHLSVILFAGGGGVYNPWSCFSQLVYLYFAFLHLSVILFAGGVCTTPGQTPPLTQTPYPLPPDGH